MLTMFVALYSEKTNDTREPCDAFILLCRKRVHISKIIQLEGKYCNARFPKKVAKESIFPTLCTLRGLSQTPLHPI